MASKMKKQVIPGVSGEQTTDQLLHELQIQQTQLESLNKEIRRTQEELKALQSHYFDLFDQAPVGYILISEKGSILEANLSAATLLGLARNALAKQPLTRFILPEDQDIYSLHRKQLFETGVAQVFELRMLRPDAQPFWVQLEANVAQDTDGEPVCRAVLSEITKRKLAEKELQESELRFHAIASNTPDHILMQDRQLRYKFVVNPQLGLTEQDMVGKTDYDILSKEEADRLTQVKTRVLESGQPVHFETSLIPKVGEPEFFDVAYIPKFDTHDKIDGLIGYFRNITERVRTEQVLQRNERNLVEAQHLAHIGSWQWTMATDAVNWSEELYHINGRDPDLSAPGYAEMSSCYTPESWKRLKKVVAKALQSGESYKLDLNIVRPDGTIRHTSARGEADYDTSGKIVGLHGTVLDITERMQAEQELLKLNKAVDASGEVIFMTDREGIITYVNPEFTHLYGYEAAEVVGKTTPRILKSGEMKPDDYQLFWRTLLDKQVLKGEFINKTKDGRILTIEGSANPVVDEQKEIIGFLAIQRDITERVREEEALQGMNDNLEICVRERTAELEQVNRALQVENAEREAAENLLGRERQRLYDVLETLPIYVVLLSADYHVPFANRFFRERFGESEGLRCYEYLFHRDVPCEICETYTVLKNAAPHQWEWIGPDGRNYYNFDFPFTDEDGAALILEVGIDITERKRAEETLQRVYDKLEQRVAKRTVELRRTNEELRTEIAERNRAEEALRNNETMLQKIFDILPVGLWITDKEGKLLRGNPEGFKIWGAEPKVDLSHFGIFKARRLSSGKKVAADDSALVFTIKDKVTIVDELLEIDAFDGKKKIILNYTAPVLDNHGDIQGAIVVNQDITTRKRSEEALEQSHEQLRALTSYWQTAFESERTHIAREIHDDFGQSMTALKMDLTWLANRLPKGDERVERIHDMNRLVDDNIARMRRIATELRPGLLDDLGLNAALEWQSQEFSRRNEIPCKLNLPKEDLALDPALNTTLFRIFQETLTNISRHAQATHVSASLKQTEQFLVLTIRDNGRGIKKAELNAPRSLGLLGLRERAAQWGGEIAINGVVGKGTTVTIRIPLPASPVKGGKR